MYSNQNMGAGPEGGHSGRGTHACWKGGTGAEGHACAREGKGTRAEGHAGAGRGEGMGAGAGAGGVGGTNAEGTGWKGGTPARGTVGGKALGTPTNGNAGWARALDSASGLACLPDRSPPA
jgi:hypothetical protein